MNTNTAVLHVFSGRWSELEMSGQGFEEFSPARLVAAQDVAAAIEALGCTATWFNLYFAECQEPDARAIALAKPGVVFESYVELDIPSTGPIVRTQHWVDLVDMPAFQAAQNEKMMARMKQAGAANGRGVGGRSPSDFNPLAALDAAGSEELVRRIVAMLPE